MGICNLCLKDKKLTREHVPPRAAYNRTTRYRTAPLIDYLKKDNPLSWKIEGRLIQGGVTFATLCKDCNSLLGVKYVDAYHQFIKRMTVIANRSKSDYFNAILHKIQPLSILKQIASMFISVNDADFAKAHNDLLEFVRDETLQMLPVRYKFYIYLNTEGALRYLPIMVSGNFHEGKIIVCSEIAYPPVGYILTIDSPQLSEPVTEITSFSNFSRGQTVDYELHINRLPTYLPIPLDYRDKKMLQHLQ